MFCDIIGSIGSALDDMGIFNIPLLGCILGACFDFWADIFGCAA